MSNVASPESVVESEGMSDSVVGVGESVSTVCSVGWYELGNRSESCGDVGAVYSRVGIVQMSWVEGVGAVLSSCVGADAVVGGVGAGRVLVFGEVGSEGSL